MSKGHGLYEYIFYGELAQLQPSDEFIAGLKHIDQIIVIINNYHWKQNPFFYEF